MKSIQKSFEKTATFKNTLLLGMVWLTMAFFIMPEAKRQNEIYANGAKGIEKMLFASHDEAYATLENYGEKGRLYFIAIALTADAFYDVVTSLALCFLLLWSFYLSNNRHLKTSQLAWLSCSILFLHILENSGMVWLVLGYPEKHPPLFFLTFCFSILKTAASIVSLGLSAWNLVIYCSNNSLSWNISKHQEQ